MRHEKINWNRVAEDMATQLFINTFGDRFEKQSIHGKVTHKKTGDTYYVVSDSVINATNSNDGQMMVLYKNQNGKLFVRETNEFRQKFEHMMEVNNEFNSQTCENE